MRSCGGWFLSLLLRDKGDEGTELGDGGGLVWGAEGERGLEEAEGFVEVDGGQRCAPRFVGLVSEPSVVSLLLLLLIREGVVEERCGVIVFGN